MENDYRFTLVDADENVIDRCADYETACQIAGEYAAVEQESAFIIDNEAELRSVQRYQVDPDCLPRAIKMMQVGMS